MVTLQILVLSFQVRILVAQLRDLRRLRRFFVALSPSAVVALDIFCYGVLFVNSEEMFLPSFRVCNMDLREECSFAALMFYMARQ